MTDAHPITGLHCLACRLPRDPAVDDRVHPGCRPAQPISDQAVAQLIATLNQRLGAVEVGSNRRRSHE